MLNIGIDDTGTMSGTVAGWCFVGLDVGSATMLEGAARQILTRYGLARFHARDFGGEPHAAYEEFVVEIRRALQKSKAALCACSLYDKPTQNDLFPFFESLLSKALNQVGMTDADEAAAVRAIAPALLTLPRLTKDFGQGSALAIYLDEDDVTRGKLASTLDFGHVKLSAQKVLSILYNAYTSKQFPNAPRLSSSGLTIADDKSVVLIQAADVIGNFSTSYILSELGARSATRLAKAKIFAENFDCPDATFFKLHVRRKNDDLELLVPSAFTFSIA